MIKFTITHQINCGVEAFWQLFFDKEFDTQMHLEALGYFSYEILEQLDTGAAITRKVVAKPRMQIPGPVAKLLGADYRQTEQGQFNKGTKVWSAKVIPSTLADKIVQEYTVRVEPKGAGQVQCIVDYHFESKLFGMGSLMDASFEKQLRDQWNLSAMVINQRLKESK